MLRGLDQGIGGAARRHPRPGGGGRTWRSALLEEWNISQHGLEARSAAGARNNAFKAWRFAGEMREIAATFEASGLPGGFHQGAADVYTRLAAYKDCDPPPELAEIIEKLLDSGT